ncbi:MAG: hypothetical protein IT454_03490 [Planctomycetes bacterium]|nr:hypothetical protein [Planctomycetota bacterium]
MAKEPDPRAEFAQFESELAGTNGLAAAYVLRGPERWFRDAALERLLERARAAEIEICRHDAKDAEFALQRVLDDLTSFAMFATTRLVVVHEPEALLKKSTNGDEASFAKAVRSFVKGRRGTLVLSADSLRSDSALVKELVAAGAKLHSFRKLYEKPPAWFKNPDPRSGELVEWLLSRARARSLPLTPDAALLLVHATGNELAALDDQLSALASGDAREALARLTSAAAGSPAEVSDALLAGEVARAARAIETLFQGGMRKDKDGVRETKGEALVAITLGFLRPRVRAGLAAAQAIELGAQPEAAATEAGVAPFDKTLRSAIAQRSPREWRAMLDDLLAIERRSRQGAEIDANEFVRLALRWSRKAAARAR